MVEELFAAAADKPKASAGPAEVAKKGKKSFFPGDKAQNLFIVTSRLPPAEKMARSVTQLDERLSVDNLESLLKNWPHDEFADLMQEYAMDKEAEWEKAEAYFIELGKLPKFDLRLQVWLFKI